MGDLFIVTIKDDFVDFIGEHKWMDNFIDEHWWINYFIDKH